MKKIILGIALILTCTSIYAEDNYVSPESYAINEGDAETVFQQITSTPTYASQAKSNIIQLNKPIKEKKVKKEKIKKEQIIQPQVQRQSTIITAPTIREENQGKQYNNNATPSEMRDSSNPSPESYAVNEDEVREIYQKLVAPQNATADTDTKSIAARYNPAEDTETGIRATLRKLRYNSMDPHHGEIHQIKKEASNKFEGK